MVAWLAFGLLVAYIQQKIYILTMKSNYEPLHDKYNGDITRYVYGRNVWVYIIQVEKAVRKLCFSKRLWSTASGPSEEG